MADDAERLRGTLGDRYAIEREVGRGGMATVYLARDVKHGRQVAIKVLRPVCPPRPAPTHPAEEPIATAAASARSTTSEDARSGTISHSNGSRQENVAHT